MRSGILALTLAGVAMLLPVAAAAQTDPAVTITAKGGLVSSTLDYSEEGDFFARAIGGAAGVAIGMPRLRLFGVGLQVEALYVQKGAKDAPAGIDGETLRLEWLEVPILARVRVGRLAGADVFAVAGPAVGTRLRARFNDIDVADQYESTAIAIVAGGGAAWGRLSLEARLHWGFTNLPVALSDERLEDRSVLVLGGFRLR